MQHVDNIRIDFKNDAQRRCYEVLAKIIISPTRYPYSPCLVTLGLIDSLRYIFSQIKWYTFLVAENPTYQNLTLEFPSSFPFQPRLGLGQNRGLATFMFFRHDY